MPNPLNQTNIIAPRVPLIDERSGLISREWYRFFLNLFVLTGSGANDTSLLDLQVGPPTQPQLDFHNIDPTPASYAAYAAGATQESQIAELEKQIQALDLSNCCAATVAELAEMQKQIQALQVQPQFDVSVITAAIAAASTAPVTKTADFILASNETWVINNKSGSTCTVTLPAASAWVGREVTFQNYQAQTLVSASSNVVPQAGGAAGTAILLAVAGNWATIVSDGTNWVIMQAAANNNLLLE